MSRIITRTEETTYYVDSKGTEYNVREMDHTFLLNAYKKACAGEGENSFNENQDIISAIGEEIIRRMKNHE